MKKTASKAKKNAAVVKDFRPYRVLFLVVVVGVTCLVLFAALGVTSD